MFNDHFEIFLADTAESKAIHYNLRYQIYCEEMEFEDKNNFPAEQELDKWDENAVPFLLRHKNTDQWVGAVRLIFRNGQLLPIEELCSVDELKNSRDSYSKQLVEVSRLCLVKEIRRKTESLHRPYENFNKQDEIHKGTNVITLNNHRQFRQSILFGLLHAAAKYSIENDINDWFWLGTDALARILRRSGLNILKVGTACQHRGKRFPFKMDPVQTFLTLSSNYAKSYFLYSELKTVEPVLQATG
jgi:N-acyl amino acid synthase of PEP-CTERM/exosortase system